METVFIYALNCPVTGRTRYIGKAKDPYIRLYGPQGHLKDKSKNHRTNWIQSLKAQGKSPILEVLDIVPVNEWRQWEVAYIEFFYEAGFDLVNGTPGGEDPPSRQGIPNSPETRAKISAALAGKPKSLEHCAAVSAALKGKHTGRKASTETRIKIRAALTGRPVSSDTREKLRTANTGVANVMRGKKLSSEVRRNMSAAQQLWRAKEKLCQ